MTATPDQLKLILQPEISFSVAGHAAKKSKAIVTFILIAGIVSILYSYDVTQTSERVSPVQYVQGNATTTIRYSDPKLYKKVAKMKNNLPRVLCWVMTGPANYQKKAIHVKRTWGKRCDKLIFMSTKNDTELGAVGLPNVPETREGLWAKTRGAFKYVWENHRDDADWFLKADDDTFVVVENLRFLLSKYDETKPIYFGCHFYPFQNKYKKGYMSGGAGYALSKGALRKFIELPSGHKCFNKPEGSEDEEMGKCMEDAGVASGDNRDALGRHRFMPIKPDYLFDPRIMNPKLWLWSYTVHPQKAGRECCSDTAISFHYITPSYMYAMDYFVNGLKSSEYPFKSALYSPYVPIIRQNNVSSSTQSLSTSNGHNR